MIVVYYTTKVLENCYFSIVIIYYYVREMLI